VQAPASDNPSVSRASTANRTLLGLSDMAALLRSTPRRACRALRGGYGSATSKRAGLERQRPERAMPLLGPTVGRPLVSKNELFPPLTLHYHALKPRSAGSSEAAERRSCGLATKLSRRCNERGAVG